MGLLILLKIFYIYITFLFLVIISLLIKFFKIKIIMNNYYDLKKNLFIIIISKIIK